MMPIPVAAQIIHVFMILLLGEFEPNNRTRRFGPFSVMAAKRCKSAAIRASQATKVRAAYAKAPS
jgi:hypothetical protein